MSQAIRLKCQILTALLIFGCSAAVGSAATVIPAGEQVTLHSEVLKEDRTIFIALPASYNTNTDRYPVLYLTDAQWMFDQARSTVQFLAREQMIPEMIVVGITNPDRTRDLYSTRADFKDGDRVIPFPNSGNADHFLEFIAKELIPWTEKSYRTSGLRILAGVSAGGNFALHAIRVKPALFQAVIVASPWLAWDDEKELTELVPFLESSKLQLREMFFSYADEGPEMKKNIDALAAALQSRSDGAVRWSSRSYPEETHNTTVIKSYYDGLRAIFAGYACPRDPKTNLLVGSIDDMKSHFGKLSEQFGARLDPPEAIVNDLGYEDLRSGLLKPAVAAFRFNVEQHPDSANAWDSLADGLERLGDLQGALASCRKAVALVENEHDARAEVFRQHLSRVEATKSPGSSH